MVLRHRATVASMTINRDQLGSSVHVVGKSATVDWNSLQSHQPLADLGIRGRVNLSALGITEEVVQRIVSTLSIVVAGDIVHVTAVADRVIDRAIGRSWLRSVVAVMCMVMMSTVAARLARVHWSSMVIVSRRWSCKML